MIIDDLQCFKNYLALHPRFGMVAKFIEETDLDNLPEGKHKINEDIYVISEKSQGKKRDAGVLEAHRCFIDVQLCRLGVDHMGWRSHAECKNIKQVYDKDKDIVFYNDEFVQQLSVNRDKFIIFFPWDAHAPNISDDFLHKIVFKVRF